MWDEYLQKLFEKFSGKAIEKVFGSFFGYLRIRKRLFDWALWKGSPVTDVWRWVWTVAIILCSFCIYFSGHWWNQPWAEFLPSGLISEATLVLLCEKCPFPVRLSFWRLSFFPVIGVWLPYLIRVLYGHSNAGPFESYFQKILHLPAPRVAEPAAFFPYGWMHFAPELACLGCTICIVVTARSFGTGSLDFFAPAHLTAYRRAPERGPARTARRSSSGTDTAGKNRSSNSKKALDKSGK
jgi:hypothetical protein